MTALFLSRSSKDNVWAESVREALRARGYQSLFLDFHPDDGMHAGAKWEQSLWKHLRRSNGVVVLCTNNWLASPWCVAEAMIARERGKPVFLLASAELESTAQIPDFLLDTQYINLAGMAPEEGFRRLLRGLEQEGLTAFFSLPDRPYPGLEPFEEADAAIFFGRDAEIRHVMAVLNQARKYNSKRFILVLGASGSGKSSLIRAGVLPRLNPVMRVAGDQHRWVVPPPFTGGRGLEGLATSLCVAFGQCGKQVAPRRLLRRLALGPSRLREVANELLVLAKQTQGNVLLIADQLEEVFGNTHGSESRSLLRLLLEAGSHEESTIVVLATMRSDFFSAFQLFPGAAHRYEQVSVDPMPRHCFGELIEKPAACFGLAVASGLTQALIDDTQHDDALPLLAFTLERLYHRCSESGLLTLNDYRNLFPPVTVYNKDGNATEYRGVSAAIKHAADDILARFGYYSLSAEEPRLRDLRHAFVRLAEVGEGGQFSRRTALWSRVPPSCIDVMSHFVQQRLLVSGQDRDGQPTLSVAHEVLFRVWDTLRLWLLEEINGLALRSSIERAAHRWIATRQETDSHQWSDERIIEAVREIERSGVSLADTENPTAVRAFLGPVKTDVLLRLPGLETSQDPDEGSAPYGDLWLLPLSHQARSRVGRRLALLGDTRRGVGLRCDGLPDIDWCPVQGGDVTLEVRVNPDDPRSGVATTLTRNIQRFWIARYPVTILQFGAFVRECYRDSGWNFPPGFLQLHLFSPEIAPPVHRSFYNNHPADGVSWWDAMAYCHWLSVRLGYNVSLPTEFQWQLAAGGHDPAMAFPWGEHWDIQHEPWRANTFESGLNGSTAVGLYPCGASPAGVHDMAGTIYEWSLNSFDDPDDVMYPTSELDRRVLRGGSWFDYQVSSRVVSRIKNLPFFRGISVGFRVACNGQE